MTTAGNRTMLPRELLNEALRREKAAYDFYEGLVEKTDVVFIRELIEDLRDEEARHVKMIKKKLTHLDTGMHL